MGTNDFSFSVKKRFIEFCGANKISQRKFANYIGISYNNINAWFNTARDTMPTIFAINYLVEEYGLDANWLISGKGEIGKTAKVETNDLTKAINELTEQVKELSRKLPGKI